MDFLSSLFGPPIPSLSAHELGEKIKSGKRLLIIDVREPEEYQTGHISRAKLIPLGELNKRMNELPKDQELICVCASGSRSSSATRQLIRSGFTAINMNGGMHSWLRAGLPIKTGKSA